MERITVMEAAKIMGKDPMFVRRGLIAGKLPFGIAQKGRGNRYSYYINPKQFFEYVGIENESSLISR